jgi:transglutaminase-like putative cysteine protease
MKFFAPLQTIRLSPLLTLDLAYILVLLPLMLIIKIPMMVFVLVMVVLIVWQKEALPSWGTVLVFLLGAFAIFLSLYGAFSFQGLSRLKIFLELLVYILLVVVAMQRLTREINFYLLLSPLLFLALSLFFFHGMVMLVYVIIEIFALLCLVLSHRMGGNIYQSFSLSTIMFMYALPWVVLLFIFFPRISFEHASYGFKGETVRRMGHDGTMYLDNKSLLVPSNKVVMEVGFTQGLPPLAQLYFRGSTLYIPKADHWEALPSYLRRKTPYYRHFGTASDLDIEYQVTLYPTQKKWIYLLDMPSFAVKDSILDADLISTRKKAIKEPLHYTAHSTLVPYIKDNLSPKILAIALAFDKANNPQSYTQAQKIQKTFGNEAQRAKALMAFFHSQNLTYSLKASPQDTVYTIDTFLFEKRYGYCVHFASAFAIMARMAGIPSRIVTGYRSDKSGSLNNYLPIREKDAHAWTELYIEGQWQRYEATNAASIKEYSQEDTDSQKDKNQKSKLWEQINLYLMYTKYKVETWVLYYSNIQQIQLLKYAKQNPLFVAYFITSILLLMLLSLSIILHLRRRKFSHKSLEILAPLLEKLHTKGYERAKKQSLHQYFLALSEEKAELKTSLSKIDKIYEQIMYASKEDKVLLRKLKKEVKSLVKVLG